jgi:hypothetical protein
MDVLSIDWSVALPGLRLAIDGEFEVMRLGAPDFAFAHGLLGHA